MWWTCHLRSEESKTYFRQSVQFIFNRVNEQFDESESEVSYLITHFGIVIYILCYFTFPLSWKSVSESLSNNFRRSCRWKIIKKTIVRGYRMSRASCNRYSKRNARALSSASFHWDAYITWTPGPWTTPAGLVHGPLRGPGPWNTPVDHPFFDDEFNQRCKQTLGSLNRRNCGQFLLSEKWAAFIIIYTCSKFLSIPYQCNGFALFWWRSNHILRLQEEEVVSC